MISLPADEQRISDVERGRCCRATVALPSSGLPAPGDNVVFALATARSGQGPVYVKGGDSVVVLLTEVLNLEQDDPYTGQPLIQLTWDPLGQGVPAVEKVARTMRGSRVSGLA